MAGQFCLAFFFLFSLKLMKRFSKGSSRVETKTVNIGIEDLMVLMKMTGFRGRVGGNSECAGALQGRKGMPKREVDVADRGVPNLL